MNPTPTYPPSANASGLAAAILVAAPPLAALAAWAVPQVLTLAQHPAAWLGGIAAAAVAVTAIAAAADGRQDAARVAWPLLLAWPLAFPLYMNRHNRLGSGLAGTLLLCGALAWSGWQIQRGEQAADFLLQAASSGPGQASGEQKSNSPSGEQIEAERERLIEQRMQRMLDAEPPR